MEFLVNYQFKDYFDRMIMATSYQESKYLVTMDKQIRKTMKKYIKDNPSRKPSAFVKVVNWTEMIEELKISS